MSVIEEYEAMKGRYEEFVKNLPVSTIKQNVFYHLENQDVTREKIIEKAQSTRPFLAKEIWDLMEKFMDFMRDLPGEEGSNYRIVYENFTPPDLIKRLLFKRPLSFLSRDSYIARADANGNNKRGRGKYYDLAKTLDPTDSPICLRDYISYDEILLAALICMSTPTYYVSDGSLRKFEIASNKPFLSEGILCGLVGARNTKAGFMEHRFIHPWQNDTHDQGVTLSDNFWIENVYSDAFPQKKIPSLEEIYSNHDIYKNIYKDEINVVYFEKRLSLSIVPYLREACARGHESMKHIFCSIPGIGAGVWAGQTSAKTIIELIVQVVLKFLDESFSMPEFKYLKAIAIPKSDATILKTFIPKGKILKITQTSSNIFTIEFREPEDHKITIYNESRYVAQVLPQEFSDCLSIAAYAWDGNSYPGNEYWKKSLASFDPQAIYCSLLGQLQNPEVNVKLADPQRIKIY
jgi:Domain of unknown function (DUF4804)